MNLFYALFPLGGALDDIMHVPVPGLWTVGSVPNVQRSPRRRKVTGLAQKPQSQAHLTFIFSWKEPNAGMGTRYALTYRAHVHGAFIPTSCQR